MIFQHRSYWERKKPTEQQGAINALGGELKQTQQSDWVLRIRESECQLKESDASEREKMRKWENVKTIGTQPNERTRPKTTANLVRLRQCFIICMCVCVFFCMCVHCVALCEYGVVNVCVEWQIQSNTNGLKVCEWTFWPLPTYTWW